MNMREMKRYFIVSSFVITVCGIIGYLSAATYVNTTTRIRFFPELGVYIEPGDTVESRYYTTDTTGFTLINNRNGVDPVMNSFELFTVAEDLIDTLIVPINTRTVDIIVKNGSYKIWLNDTLNGSPIITSEHWQFDVIKTVRYIIFQAEEDSSLCEIHCLDERLLK